MALASIRNGYRPEQKQLENPVNIQGVGNGTNQIKFNMICPLAIPTCEREQPEGFPSQIFPITGGIVEEPGDELPGLLGMDVLEGKRAILDIGNQQLIFPGPGKVEMSFPPGTVITPLAKAPSGHLCMLIDAYDQLEHKTGGIINREEESFRLKPTSQRAAASSRSSSSGAYAPPAAL